MKQKQIKQKIAEVEKELETTDINLSTAEYYKLLLNIHDTLWAFLYFKVNLEKDFLNEDKEDKNV